MVVWGGFHIGESLKVYRKAQVTAQRNRLRINIYTNFHLLFVVSLLLWGVYLIGNCRREETKWNITIYSITSGGHVAHPFQ